MTFTDDRQPAPATSLILDSTPGPEPQHHGAPPGAPRWARWRARIIFLLVLAAVAAVAVRQIDVHLAAQRRLPLGTVTLTADPVDILSPVTGTVVYAPVGDERPVSAGQVLMKIAGVGSNGKPTTATLRAPLAGATASVPVQPGSTVQNGQLVVRLYQPGHLYFLAQFPSRNLDKVRIGMLAHLSLHSLPPVLARVARVEAQLGVNPATVPTSTLVLVPVSPAGVRDLVPGLQFGGWLQVGSAPRGAPSGLLGAN